MEGIGDFSAGLDTVIVRLREAGEVIANRGAALVATIAKTNVRHVFSSAQKGKLAGSIQPKPAVSLGSLWTANVEVGIIYGRIQELGGTIVPVNGTFLIWRDEQTGDLIFARSVTLPARPYFAPALRTAATPFRALAASVLTDALGVGA